MNQHAVAKNGSTQKKTSGAGDQRAGTFSDAGEKAKKAFFAHRAKAKDAPVKPLTNLGKKMQSSGG
jgi:hypothetical protein